MTPLIVGGITLGIALFIVGMAIERTMTKRRLGHLINAPVATPPSVYPKINSAACICVGACISACPEKDVLAMIDGRPRLVQPSACVGHSDCVRSCPVNAIELVLGSELRPVEVPIASATFETTVPGLHVAGEISGIGLIHNAVAQGRQAAASALATAGEHGCEFDIAIVGAGPAGIGAALEAKRRGVRYAVLEKGGFGGAIRSYPRAKIVMTAPMDLPGIGKIKMRRTSKEALFETLDDAVRRADLKITEHAEVRSVVACDDGFAIETGDRRLTARRVIVAIGRRGIPRKLDVPGADLPHVTYEVLEPSEHRGKLCVVVGGGDSALELALALSAQSGTRVTLVHRGAGLSRAKPDNLRAIEVAQRVGRIRVRLSTEVERVHPDCVELTSGDQIRATLVVCCLGAELPSAWLRDLGIELRTLRGEPLLQT